MKKGLKIGGQALENGILIKSKKKYTIARRINGRIVEKSGFLRANESYDEIPFLRGFYSIKNLGKSFYSNLLKESFSKEKRSSTKAKIRTMISFFLSLGGVVILLIFLPTLVLEPFTDRLNFPLLLNILEGILRLILFILPIKFLHRISEIREILEYHGAEHKVIHCYEEGQALTVSNVQSFPKAHSLCGTQLVYYFFLVFMIGSILFMWPELPLRLLLRFLLIPLAGILGYELFLTEKKEVFLLDKVHGIFLRLQDQTTVLEPKKEKIEVAIRAIRPVIGDTRMKIEDVLKIFGKVEGYLILEKVLNQTISQIKLNPPFELTKEQEEEIQEIKGLYSKKPLQYILGVWNFYGRDFKVRENVLIPRFDTENLVEVLIHNTKFKKVLDIGTGTGIIAITIGLECPEAKVIGVDISEEAVALARENKLTLEAENVEIRQGNLFEPVQGEKFDLICSNPPYISKKEMEELDWKVRSEPSLALYGGEDGLDYYREIIKESVHYLEPGGTIGFEIGKDQGNDVELILADYGFEDIKIMQDLQGFDRVVYGRFRSGRN